MSTKRMTRVNALLRREIGEALFRVVDANDLDISTVTVTHVITGSDLRNATVLVSVRGGGQARQNALRTLAKYRGEIQRYIGKTVVLKYMPRLLFRLDTSLSEGDHVLGILNSLGAGDDHAPPPEEQQPEHE